MSIPSRTTCFTPRSRRTGSNNRERETPLGNYKLQHAATVVPPEDFHSKIVTGPERSFLGQQTLLFDRGSGGVRTPSLGPAMDLRWGPAQDLAIERDNQQQ